MKVQTLLRHEHVSLVEDFCTKCNELGWINNNSLSRMRWHETYESGGGWLGIIDDDSLISVAGYEPFPEKGLDSVRIFFRSATLPKTTNRALFKGTSPKGRAYLKKYIQLLPDKNLYVTTNIENTEYSYITRFDKVMRIESKQRNTHVIDCGKMYLNNTLQSIWKIDVKKFKEKYLNDNRKTN